ncbi:Der GTPase-activating protein YihI [Photobacterium damselae]|uniref:Der GTPase-activating protein YihI n=1 Tax=Photobacterium damselae TaxID=38293 RepID=UPI00370B6252
MTRKKKGRKPGSEGPAVYREKSVSQLEKEAVERKKDRKRKGLKAGSRHSSTVVTKQKSGNKPKDPRLGSKKPIPLIVEAQKPMTKKERRLSAQQELEMLENDPQLITLLDRLDAGEKLGSGLQKQVDQKLDRIEQLMKQLGLLDETEEEMMDDELPMTRAHSDDDLLDQFEKMDFDSFGKE